MTTLFGSKDSAAPLETKEPAWFSSSNKRVIPNHLVPKKKIGFQLSAVTSTKKDSKASTHSASSGSTQTFNATDFNLISFGNTSPTKPAANRADSQALFLTGSANDSVSYDREDLPLYNNKEDMPPSRSIYDLNDEVIISLNKPTQHTESFINKDPRNFNNAFSQNPEAPQSLDDDAAALKNPLSNSESAILVFGYPEHLANQVIAYFSEFGTILENFEAAKVSEKSKLKSVATARAAGAFTSDSFSESARSTVAPPIFSGPSWVKLTYDNPSSALDALQESGSVFNGAIIGVAPYSKDTIEKLQKRKLESSEDIGGGLRLFSHPESLQTDKGVIGDSNDMQATYIKRLEVKDGSEMFLKANVGNGSQPGDKKDSQKLGWWASISNYFFGFHDL